jgi:hypothetical protein
MPEIANNRSALVAYKRILRLDHQLASGQDLRVKARILGRILIHAPSEEGRSYAAGAINSCETDDHVFILADFHLKHFVNYSECSRLRLFRSRTSS